MNGPQDSPQAPQSPVPAGDALGPPDTHTDAQSVSVREMLEWTLDAYPDDIWPTPPPELQAKDAAAAHVMRSVALPIIREALDEIDRLQALAAAADRVLADREARSSAMPDDRLSQGGS